MLVLEQHHTVGGAAQSFRRHDDAYRFDVGLHAVGECHPGGRVRSLLAALGVDERARRWRRRPG